MRNPFTHKRVMTAMMAFAVLTTSFGASAASNFDDEETRSLPDFHTISVKGAIADLEVKMGKRQKVHVTVDEMDISKVKTYVEDGVLYIDTRKKKSFWGNSSTGEVGIELVMTEFRGMKVSGAVDGDIEGVSGKNVFFSVAGAVDLDVKDLRSENIKLSVAGAANMDVNGSCSTLSLSIAGAGDLDAKDLRCENVSVSLAGAGDAEIYASKKINAVVSGVAEITVHGNPKNVKKKVNGFGNITVKK